MIYEYLISYIAQIEALSDEDADDKVSDLDLPGYKSDSMEATFLEITNE